MSTRTCPHCRLTYAPEFEEDRRLHRSHHRRIVGMKKQAYEPKPIKSFLICLQQEEFPEHVTWLSPRWKHRQMYLRARAFRNEFGYDFIQWADGIEKDENAHGFLFHEDGVIIGACAFRRRRDHWGMQWIWLAPQARRKGILTKWWPRFVKMFGNFDVEQPLSEAMTAFVKKMGHEC